MSLINQLIAAVFAVLIGLVAGTIAVMSDSAKDMLLRQLESHAQDTATHLGLYLAPYIASDDIATIETTVNAIFDSGYYQEIRIIKANGDVLSTTPTPVTIKNQAPQWFNSLIDINPPKMSQAVSFNWQRVGRVEVMGRADYAYQQLWQGVEETLIWFTSMALMCVFMLSYLIRRILKPLKAVEKQAEALSNRQFITVSDIPKTTELKTVVEAMNKMVSRVQAMFANQTQYIEELHQAASKDNVTGLTNFKATESLIADWFDYRNEFGDGDCVFLHLNKLQDINHQLGSDKTNLLLKEVSERLQQFAQQSREHITGRLAGSDLVTIIPRSDEETCKREVQHLSSDLNQVFAFYQLNGQEHISVSVTQVDANHHATQILSQARSQAYLVAESTEQIAYPATYSSGNRVSSWATHVVDAVNLRQLSLHYQSVMNTDREAVHHELLARIHNQQGEICPASDFLTIVKENNLTTTLDLQVLKMAIETIKKQPTSVPLVVNLSHETIQNHSTDHWVDLLKHRSLTSKLCIEVNETTVLNDINRVIAFRECLQSLGIMFGIDNFGQHPTGFSYLYSIHPDYIKIDGSLVRNVDQNNAGQFFIQSLTTAAKSLEITVFAERVETEKEADSLIALGIDGTQGFLHGRPMTFAVSE